MSESQQPVQQPQQPAPVKKAKKPLVKRVWFWILVVIAVIIIYSATQSGKTSPASSAPATSAATTSQSPAEKKEEPKKTEEAAKPSVPVEYTNALEKAEQYSSMMHMSKKGIYDQLTSEAGEKFSAEAGQYAVDNLKADYNANALAKAKEYQEQMSMSPSAIRDQLTSEAGEKFTASEADYAVQHLND